MVSQPDCAPILEAVETRGVHGRGDAVGIRWRDGKVVLAGLENDTAFDAGLLLELATWAPYLLALNVERWVRRRPGRAAPTLAFSPRHPGPWYTIVGAAAWGGVKIDRRKTSAAQRVYFDDRTEARGSHPPASDINGRCFDIRKSHVASVFGVVFGYDLAIHAASHVGAMVEKPEQNGAHAGRIVAGPQPAVAGLTYQKLIDTEDANGFCNDLRTPCIGGAPVLVWRKRKRPLKRFGIQNEGVALLSPDTVFRAEEIELIKAFNARIGLDCGGLDILRDAQDGRIYIVDVNKTDLGPPIALSWRDKLASMRLLGDALNAWLTERAKAHVVEDKTA
jgi:hypothetical protein